MTKNESTSKKETGVSDKAEKTEKVEDAKPIDINAGPAMFAPEGDEGTATDTATSAETEWVAEYESTASVAPSTPLAGLLAAALGAILIAAGFIFPRLEIGEGGVGYEQLVQSLQSGTATVIYDFSLVMCLVFLLLAVAVAASRVEALIWPSAIGAFIFAVVTAAVSLQPILALQDTLAMNLEVSELPGVAAPTIEIGLGSWLLWLGIIVMVAAAFLMQVGASAKQNFQYVDSYDALTDEDDSDSDDKTRPDLKVTS